MAGRGRPKAELTLSDEERETLQRWSRRAKSAQALALRCRIVLACGDGMSNVEVAQLLGVSRPTVGKWRSRFLLRRLEGLVDEDRPGAPRTITDEQVEDVVVATLESTPKDATHWSRASMAKRSGLSKSSVGRIWKAFRLKPHLSETFKLSTRPAVHREGPRRGRPVPGPAERAGGAVRRREDPGPGLSGVALRDSATTDKRCPQCPECRFRNSYLW